MSVCLLLGGAEYTTISMFISVQASCDLGDDIDELLCVLALLCRP